MLLGSLSVPPPVGIERHSGYNSINLAAIAPSVAFALRKSASSRLTEPSWLWNSAPVKTIKSRLIFPTTENHIRTEAVYQDLKENHIYLLFKYSKTVLSTSTADSVYISFTRNSLAPSKPLTYAL